MAQSDRDFLAWSARWAIVGVMLFAVALGLLWVLKAALTPLVAAFVIAYLFDPLIDRFEARRVKRSAAIFLLLALMGGGMASLLFVLIPRMQSEFSSLAQRMPGYFERIVQEWIPTLEARFGFQLPGTLRELADQARAGDFPLPFDRAGELLTGLIGYLTGTLGSLVALLVIPILAYYLLVEFDTLVDRAGHWVPPRHREYVFAKVRTVDRLISSFLRGQLLIAAILGVLYAVGFAVIGIDLALGIGLLAGVLALVPYLGNVVALGAASTLSILKFGVDGHLIAVVVWYAIVQNLEGFVLTPRIQGRSVGLHPAVVIVALLIGADLFGFLGLLIAVPAAAVAKVFVDELLEAYRGSPLFDEPADSIPPESG